MQIVQIKLFTRLMLFFVVVVSSARLNKMDIDTNSFTSQELKKALAKMKESEKAERMVRTVVSKAKHGLLMQMHYVAFLGNMMVKASHHISCCHSWRATADVKL